MNKINIVFVLLALVALLMLSASQPAKRLTSNNRIAYANGFMGNATAIAQLGELKRAGLTTLLSGSWGYTDVAKIITAIKTDPNLKGYKLVIAIDGMIWDAWNNCIHDPTCNLKTYLPQSLKDKLTPIIELAKANPDIVAGYYTFDEPALQKREDLPNVKGVDKEYQQTIYNFIRARDPDKVSRPIIVANTMWSLDDATIDRTMSATVQDVIFIDHYTTDPVAQKTWLKLWKSHNLVNQQSQIAFVLPTFNSECKALDVPKYERMLGDVMSDVFGHKQPKLWGVSYFAFWPDPKPDFKFGVDNCAALFKSLVDGMR